MNSFTLAAIMAATAFAGPGLTTEFRGPLLEDKALATGTYTWHIEDGENEFIETEGSMSVTLQGDLVFGDNSKAEVWMCIDGTTECIFYSYNNSTPATQKEVSVSRTVMEVGENWPTFVESIVGTTLLPSA